jgi:hypothetical protein
MKTLSILTSVIVLGSLVAQGEPTQEQKSTGQVSLRATDKTIRPEREKKKDDDKKGPKKDDKGKPETVTKAIEVEISAAKSINGPLKIVTSWYGRDMGTKKQVMAKKHESEVTLDAAKTAKASVPPFAFTFTPAHSTKAGRVDATGQNYYGWVIRAYEGTTLVGETASTPPLLKLQE